MKLKEINYAYTLQEITDIVDGRFGESDYKYYNIGENGVILNGIQNPEELALRNKALTLLLELRNINLWLTGVTMNHNNPPTLDEIKEREKERDAKYNELIRMGLFTNNHKQPKPDAIGDDANKPQRTIKETEIRKYFKPKLNNRKEQGSGLSQADYIIEMLKVNRKGKMEYAMIALIFYDSSFIECTKEGEKMSFKEWSQIFYGLMNLESCKYIQNHKIHISDELKKDFVFLYQ